MKPIILTALLLSFTYSGLSGATQKCGPDSLANAPDSRYNMNADGTVTDNKTGLSWMRCALGQSWDGAACTGSPQIYSWQKALQVAENTDFANQSDWRLPNKNELQSLVEYGCHHPSINLTAFPNATSHWFLSSSPYAHYSGSAWIIHFDVGTDANGSNKYAVRLVRGE
ncbi:MAG: DUF1566 domain-containing protein [Methylobacter sp.]|nr:MAG: DUF1566 domain-containing protein [Methylobacter sp.]